MDGRIEDRGAPNPRQAEVDRVRDAASALAARSRASGSRGEQAAQKAGPADGRSGDDGALKPEPNAD